MDRHNNFREARTDFNIDVKRFLRNLVNFSLHLKKRPADSRKALGRKFLNNINGWLYRRKFSKKKLQTDASHQYLYEGLLFPFSLEEKVASTLVILAKKIVRVVHSEISCFETKKRVPYRIVVETIE